MGELQGPSDKSSFIPNRRDSAPRKGTPAILPPTEANKTVTHDREKSRKTSDASGITPPGSQTSDGGSSQPRGTKYMDMIREARDKIKDTASAEPPRRSMIDTATTAANTAVDTVGEMVDQAGSFFLRNPLGTGEEVLRYIDETARRKVREALKPPEDPKEPVDPTGVFSSDRMRRERLEEENREFFEGGRTRNSEGKNVPSTILRQPQVRDGETNASAN